MINRSKAVAILTVGATLLAAGSAFAVKTLSPVTPAMAGEVACPATMSVPTSALNSDTRWKDLWQPANADLSRDLSRLGWVNCSSGREFGTVGGVDLSTLPIMR